VPEYERPNRMITLATRDPGFNTAFAALLAAKRESTAEVDMAVARIIDDVAGRGDAALVEYTNRFDRVSLNAATLRLGPDEIAAGAAAAPPDTVAALRLAAERIEAFHRRQLPSDIDYVDEAGVRLGQRWRAIEAVGLYVPGGTASYPSSVLMNAIPARVAGVARLAMVVPAPDGVLNPLVLAAARLVGIDEIYRVGGAQAVAALAYGTATIAPVDKIVGPGNAYVAAAKRRVFGQVGIDMIAGPSEILVVADRHNDPCWIAADLLSQAEHDEAAQPILIADDAGFAAAVEREVERHLQILPRGAIARASWRGNGAMILVADWDEAIPLIDRIAPEHLELAVENPDSIARRVRHAGAIFLGRHTPEAIGDYVAGPNHVLPTARSARFASGLGVLDFMKRTTLVGCDPDSLAALAPAAIRLAEAEGLDAHALSLTLRLSRS
jgi:histidinol dehydrogenase